MALRKGQKSKDELAKDTPGYLPPGSRPKCLACQRELVLNIHHPWVEQRLDYDRVEKVGYGHADNGIFCTKECGYQYGLAAAKLVIEKRLKDAKEEQEFWADFDANPGRAMAELERQNRATK